jgi:hypothetical protein
MILPPYVDLVAVCTNPKSSMEGDRISSISLAAASKSLTIETVPGFHALPDVVETMYRFTAVFSND